MIGKHIANPKTHSSFKTLNDYITGKAKRRLEEAGEKIAFTGCLNLLSVDTATLQMNSLAFQNKRVADPVMHLLLSWRENENPTREQVNEAVEITLRELNLSQCQAVYALRQNTDNMHLHICVNRIDPETTKAIIPAGPLDDANRSNKNWSAYIRARTEHSKENKERRERLYMTQQKEREATRDRQKLERQALAESFDKGFSRARQTINRQRSILATQHAYERAILKEKQKKQRESLKIQSAAFISYEEWLRNLNLPEEAEKWRHRKNKRILLLERPNDTATKDPQEYTGLSGFLMTVTNQGVKFASQGSPGAVAFIDVGRVIKVYPFKPSPCRKSEKTIKLKSRRDEKEYVFIKL